MYFERTFFVFTQKCTDRTELLNYLMKFQGVSYFCPLCRRNLETAEHLMMQCPWTVSLWEMAATKFSLPAFSPAAWRRGATFEDWLADLFTASPTAKKARSLAMLLLWEIWRERNDHIFRDVELPPSSVLRRVDEERTT